MFTHSFLLLKYIDIENLTELTVLQFNLKNFLESEIYKAKKGKYDFSLVAIQFDSTTENKGENAHYEFYNYSEKIYKEMKSLWGILEVRFKEFQFRLIINMNF